MENKELLENVSKLGFPLFEAEEKFNVSETLAEVLKSNDSRLLEGFPVLLANAYKDNSFSYRNVLNYLDEEEHGALLKELLLLSLCLYKNFNLYFSWTKDYQNELSKEDLDRMSEYRNSLSHDSNFKLMGYTFSSERFKNVFTLYLTQEVDEVKKQTEKQVDFSLEYALSQVFSPKQKELFMKKVKGVDLSKTEKEYFSRTVKKKLLALVNPELSRFARLLLE